MTIEEIRKVVIQAYTERYPEWGEVRVSDIVQDTFGGHLAVVRPKNEPEEMCFVYPEGTVRIFTSTEDLARFLEQKAKASFVERLFTRPVLSGLVFAFLLVAVFIIGFSASFKPEALAILGSVVGVAAGFFFGSGKTSA